MQRVSFPLIGHALAAMAAGAVRAMGTPELKAKAEALAAAQARLALQVPRGRKGTVLRRAAYRDRSRYSGAILRAIRAERGCGRPPKVLAARRAKIAAARQMTEAA
jgi:hypothetical protein